MFSLRQEISINFSRVVIIEKVEKCLNLLIIFI